MIYENQAELKDRIEGLTRRKVGSKIKILEDTTSFMAVYGGSVLRLQGNDYFVMGDTREGRFGIDDQPKFWVKYAVDLATGQDKIIKLVFHEQFTTKIGPIAVRCVRSPEKERDFLELVKGDDRFMQGFSVVDPAGNLVRIIDFIEGKSFFNHVTMLKMSHEDYFNEKLPELMAKLIKAFDAMVWVHSQGLHHGDIRNDHLFIASDDERPVWIDFDYTVNVLDYDIWGMGNILIYATAKGITTFRAVQKHPNRFPHLVGSLQPTDASAFYPYRVANIGRLYPYIPKALNDILMRFSEGTWDFYEDMQELVDDLKLAFGVE